MRLIYTLNDQKQALILSTFLTAEGVVNQLEITTNTDWGSPQYGDAVCHLWIYDEDQVEVAEKWISAFKAQPDNPVFLKRISHVAPVITPVNAPLPAAGHAAATSKISQHLPQKSTTIYLILLCSLLFFIDMMTAPHITAIATNLPALPQMASPVEKAALYDYPLTYELADKLVNLYGIGQLQEPQELPAHGKYLLAQLQKTPYWHGAYALFMHPSTQADTLQEITPTLFEKIRQGEFWRLFSPCLMHHDILHLLFNMLWLIVLGQQMEQRLGAGRYLLFALVTGIFSNTCQYLMSGPDFIGYSGIICGMLTFIWMRQKVAAWEGYPLQKATINFMIFFILAMLSIQLVSFYLEINHEMSISPGIANTAHLAGAAFGALLGRLSFFSWKT